MIYIKRLIVNSLQAYFYEDMKYYMEYYKVWQKWSLSLILRKRCPISVFLL